MSDTDQIKEFNKTYNRLLPSIKKLYNSYKFLDLTQEKFEELVQDFLLEIYNKQNQLKLDDNSYIKSLKSYLDVYVKITIAEPENSIRIINNYIYDKLSINKDAIKELKKLSNFLEKYNFIPQPDICIELIKQNQILNKILQSIVDANIRTITSSGIDSLELSETTSLFIEVYCTINDIVKEIDEDKQPETQDDSYYTDDSVKAYLKEIRVPLLKAEEEVELGIRISEGDEKARNILIEHNLRLVVSVAKGYQNKGMELLELIQEGNLGLITASKKWDYSRGLKFSTYATWWIRQAISRAIMDKSKSIRIPVHIHTRISKYQKAAIELQQRLNRTPKLEEIAEYLNLSLEKLQEIIECQQDTLSLNELINGEDDTEMLDFVPSKTDTPDVVVSNMIESEELKHLLQICTKNDRELEVMLMRYGFTGRVHTLEEIGQMLGVTRERIRQIEDKVIKKMKTPKYQRILLGSHLTPTEELNNRIRITAQLLSLPSEEVAPPVNQEINVPAEISAPKTKTVESKEPILGILDIFKKEGYTKEEIISILPYLGQEDKRILELTNGSNLDNPITSEKIKYQDREDYKWITIPRIRTILNSMYGPRDPSEMELENLSTRKPKIELTVVEYNDRPTNNQKKYMIQQESTKEIVKMNDKKSNTTKVTSIPVEVSGKDINRVTTEKTTDKVEDTQVPKDMSQQGKTKGSRMTTFENLGRYGYTKEEILDIINELNETDKDMIKLIDGEDLEHPKKNDKATSKDVTKYHTQTIPKILRRLKNKYGFRDTEFANEQLIKKRKDKPTDTVETTKKRGKARTSLIKKFGDLGYTKEEIEQVINVLSEHDKIIITILNGTDLEHPVKSSQATRTEENAYYQRIIPKIQKRLVETFGDKKILIHQESQSKIDIEQPQVVSEESQNLEGTTPKPNDLTAMPSITEDHVKLALQGDKDDVSIPILQSIFRDELSEQLTVPVETPISPNETLTTPDEITPDEPTMAPAANNNIVKEDYIKMLEFLKTPTFYELMSSLPVKKAIIIALRLGYIDDKYFTTESIATFLNISEEEVRETTIEILNLHKNRFNYIIDEVSTYLNKEGYARTLNQIDSRK